MKKADLEKKLQEIEAQLNNLGDLSELIDEGNKLPSLSADLTKQKEELEAVLETLPDDEKKLVSLTEQVETLRLELDEREKVVSSLTDKTEKLHTKTDALRQETLTQLGKASNEKLAHTFSVVQSKLIEERDTWLKRLACATAVLIVVTVGIVSWQVLEGKSIYDLSFIVKIAITSPIVYTVVFINREYARIRSLIEEYTFKSAIARSLEAYTEILDNAYAKQKLEVQREKLAFLLKSISDLYSSPMRNIKDNHTGNDEESPDIFSSIRRFLVDTYKDIASPQK
jgi:hypothetical protein